MSVYNFKVNSIDATYYDLEITTQDTTSEHNEVATGFIPFGTSYLFFSEDDTTFRTHGSWTRGSASGSYNETGTSAVSSFSPSPESLPYLHDFFGDSYTNFVQACNESLAIHKFRTLLDSRIITSGTNRGLAVQQGEAYVFAGITPRSNWDSNVSPTVMFKPYDQYASEHTESSINLTTSQMLSLIHLKEDIEEGKIQVPPELKALLDDGLDVGKWTSQYATYYVNIDGTKNPNISIRYEVPYIEEKADSSMELRGSAGFLGVENTDYIGRYHIESLPINNSWKAWVEKIPSSDITDKLNALLSNLTSNPSFAVCLFFRTTYIIRGTKSDTSWCYVIINYDGSVANSGVLKPDGSSVVITRNDTDDVYHDDRFIDEEDDIDGTDYGVTGLSLMTKSYAMSPSRLKQLGNFLWSADFFDNIRLLNNSPIQNVVSCKVFPMSISGGADTSIVLGNVDTGVMGEPIGDTQKFNIDVGSFTIPRFYNNFLDYQYTKIGIFLPFCGFHTIDVDSVMGKTLSVKYFVDVLTGVCKACLFVNDILVEEFGGQIGFDIPLCAQDRSQTELEQITGISNVVTSAIGRDVGGVISGATHLFAPADHFHTVGTASPSINMMTTHDVFLVIERPIVEYPSNYNHVYGKPCNLTLTLNNCRGFTQCASVDCSTIPCTDMEKDMIKAKLESGVYINA